MSGTSKLLGLLVAVLVHSAVFLPGGLTLLAGKKPEEETRVTGKIALVEALMKEEAAHREELPEMPHVPPPETASVPDAAEAMQAAANQVAASPPVEVANKEFRQVINRAALESADGGAGSVATISTTDGVPPLRISWASRDQLEAVAQSLGIKIAAVNADDEIIGEVSFGGDSRIEQFSGDLGRYSNRIRVLGPSFFGKIQGASAHSYWLLVPAHLDALLAQSQREAARRLGVDINKVRSMTGRFEREASGTWVLVIADVHPR